MKNYLEAVWLRESSGTLYFPLRCALLLTDKVKVPAGFGKQDLEKIVRDLGWFRYYIFIVDVTERESG
jgi:hypothetical protein